MEEKKITAQEENVLAASEYAYEAIPDGAKKSAWSMVIVLAGYLIAMSNFVTGAAVGYKMTFGDAVKALCVSDIYLVFICIAMGLIAFKFGITTTVMSRKVLGKKGSLVLSVILSLSVVCWLGTNGDTFAKMIVAAFPIWPIPVGITAVILMFVWLQSASRGYKGLEVVSMLGVPAAILLCIWVVMAAYKATNNFESVLAYVPEGNYSFTQATTAGVGSWIFGAISSMDVIRFAKKKSHFVVGGIVSFFICLLALQLTGVICAQATGKSDFVSSAAGLGIALPTLICSFFALWTTQDNNIYSATLSIQNILGQTSLKGRFKHKSIAYALAILAAAFSLTGVLNHVLTFVSTLSVLLAPIPGLYLSEVYIIKNSSEARSFSSWGFISWIAAGAAGYYCNANNVLVPPVISFLVAFTFYTVLGKLLGKESSQ